MAAVWSLFVTTTTTADRHLLFGLLALQNGMINQGQLLAAFQAWALDKTRSLADHLEAKIDYFAIGRLHYESMVAISVGIFPIPDMDRLARVGEMAALSLGGIGWR